MGPQECWAADRTQSNTCSLPGIAALHPAQAAGSNLRGKQVILHKTNDAFEARGDVSGNKGPNYFDSVIYAKTFVNAFCSQPK